MGGKLSVPSLGKWGRRSHSLATMEPLLERYEACMVLGAVGDSLGYYNGKWEFCHSGATIHKELKEMGGLKGLLIRSEFPLLIISFTLN